MNFPTIPDIDPNATSLSASLPCPENESPAMVSATDTGPSETSMILQGAELTCDELGHKYNCYRRSMMRPDLIVQSKR